MTETRKIKRGVPQDVASSDAIMLTREYLNTKSLLDKTTLRLNELKKSLSEMVDEAGHEDDKGNLWMPVGDHQCKKEKRLSVSLDEPRAEAWAREIGIWDSVKVVTEKLDLDKLMAVCWENEEHRQIVDKMFQEKVTWAFKVIEKKRDYYEE